MSYATVSYTGNGSNQNFNIPFPYIDRSDIVVTVGGVVRVLDTHYSFSNSTTINILTAPGAGVPVQIKRETNINTVAVEFSDKAILISEALNTNAEQTLYVSQELYDASEDIIGAVDAANTAVDAANTAAVTANNAAATANAAAATIGDKANSGDNSDITSLSACTTITGLTTPLSIAQGGTGAGDLNALAKEASTQTIWIPAGAMTPRTSNGCASGAVETATNKVMIKTLDFDAAAIEYAQFSISMPKGWNEGTVTAEFIWSHAETTTNFGVVWGIQGVAVSNDDALDVAFGTAVTVTDTGGTTNDIYRSSATSAMTIAGTPSERDTVIFQVYRDATDGSDTMTIDARLHGVALFYTTTSLNDA
jgi:hypothetical protein